MIPSPIAEVREEKTTTSGPLTAAPPKAQTGSEELPKTSGNSLLALGAAALLVGGGLLARRIFPKRHKVDRQGGSLRGSALFVRGSVILYRPRSYFRTPRLILSGDASQCPQ